ncbi:MAG: hypothetical protein ACYDGR_17360, partial [Candidatus Dormibacteria bacterium]
AAALAATAILAGCSPSAAPRATGASHCADFTPLPIQPNEPPPAIFKDAASGPYEFLAGIPGQRPRLFPGIGTSNLPRHVAQRLYYNTSRPGSASEYDIQVAREGQCPETVTAGLLDSVSPDGRAMVIFVGNERRLVDEHGRILKSLKNGSYSWTNDSHLVDSDATGITVSDHFGQHSRLLVPGYSLVLGSLGPSSLLYSTTTGVFKVDAASSIAGPPARLTATRLLAGAGSPDGKYLAGVDQAGTATVLRIADQVIVPVSPPGPPLQFLWSPDSAWVALQTQFGGLVLRVGDGRTIDLGSLNVVSW